MPSARKRRRATRRYKSETEGRRYRRRDLREQRRLRSSERERAPWRKSERRKSVAGDSPLAQLLSWQQATALYERVVPLAPSRTTKASAKAPTRPVASDWLSEFYAHAFGARLRLPPVILEQRPELPA